MKTEITFDSEKIMDVRGIPCLIKHGRIIKRFVDLPTGDYFVLVNDHDPVRLRDQFSAQWPQTFSWDYVTRRPDEIHVKIGKIAPIADCANLAKPMAKKGESVLSVFTNLFNRKS